ncbi:hypothetical protein [Deinococcus sp. Arct2-2]|nr:hypothetical protein [Deinococcus sp. Arct2-2]
MDSENRAAELYRRLPNGWTQETVQNKVKLPCVNVELGLDEIYDGVTL